MEKSHNDVFPRNILLQLMVNCVCVIWKNVTLLSAIQVFSTIELRLNIKQGHILQSSPNSCTSVPRRSSTLLASISWAQCRVTGLKILEPTAGVVKWQLFLIYKGERWPTSALRPIPRTYYVSVGKWDGPLSCGIVGLFGTLSSSLVGIKPFESQASALGNFRPSHVIYWLFVYPFFYEGFLSGCLLWKKGLIYGRLLVFFVILNASECDYSFFQVTLLDGVIIGPLSLCFICVEILSFRIVHESYFFPETLPSLCCWLFKRGFWFAKWHFNHYSSLWNEA